MTQGHATASQHKQAAHQGQGEGMSCLKIADLKSMAHALRLLSVDAIEAAKSGHPGLPLGMADVATVLWAEFLNVSPTNPAWPNRDRFVLSAGHGSMLLYALLHLGGFGLPLAQLKQFRVLGSQTPGHPEYGETPGVDVTTGPLAQGFAHAVGMALSEAMLRAEAGADLMDHFTYVVAGDGCLMEGLSSEAASFAGHMKLARLVVLFDDNKISIDGPTSLATSDDHAKRFEGMGWQVLTCDGHDMDAIRQALQAARADTRRPSFIRCETTIGYGAPTKQGTAAVHGAPLGGDEARAARATFGYKDAALFEVKSDVRDLWQKAVAQRGQKREAAWQKACDKKLQSDPSTTQSFLERLQNQHPKNWTSAFDQACKAVFAAPKADEAPPSEATRVSFGKALEALQKALPGLVGGSADLTPSNNTKTKAMKAVAAPDYVGDYIHFGVREHLMGAALNGMVLHGGLVPYGGTFLAFSDYMRPAIRLAALMKIPTLYIFTHDSVGLGEDGPTHQPIEHLWGLRDIPNLSLFRPADACEVQECLKAALLKRDGPSALILSRQKVAPVRAIADPKGQLQDACLKGGYVLKDALGPYQVTLWATGSEVSLALLVQQALEAQGVGARLVSVPCLELLAQQSSLYRRTLYQGEAEGEAGTLPLQVSLEAGVTRPWAAYLGKGALHFGINRFGASGKGDAVMHALGLEPKAIANSILQRLQKA
ncbi:MAG: transketolase [Holosporaceae bacterium]